MALKYRIVISVFCIVALSIFIIPMGVVQAQTPTPNPDLTTLCSNAPDGLQKQDCIDCMGQEGKIWTAAGCFDTDPTSFIRITLGFGSGIAGGIAFLLILLGGFQILTSAGNPEQLNAGRELVTSSVVGLLFIVLSIYLLKVIGVDILGLPGFTQ